MVANSLSAAPESAISLSSQQYAVQLYALFLPLSDASTSSASYGTVLGLLRTSTEGDLTLRSKY